MSSLARVRQQEHQFTLTSTSEQLPRRSAALRTLLGYSTAGGTFQRAK